MAETRKKRDVTEPCPDCGGSGVISQYYTLGDKVCETCGGSGEIPKGEAKQMRAKRQEPDGASPDK